MLFANVCARSICSCYGLWFWVLRFLGFLLLLCVLVDMGTARKFWLCWAPCCVQDLGYSGVPPAGHALWAEVGGGITFVTSGENT